MTGRLGLRVEHAALDGAAADLQRTVRDIDERLARLDADLAPLRSDWEGAQQEAYRAAKSAWDRAMHEMRDVLDRTHRAVSVANADYAGADRRGAARFDF